MFRPSGVVYPIGLAMPGRTKVLARPVARVSSSTPPLPEKTWNSARLPSGDQATSCGANRQFGQLVSWYLVPAGLIRSSAAGPDPPSGAAETYSASTHPVPTRCHGTLARTVALARVVPLAAGAAT